MTAAMPPGSAPAPDRARVAGLFLVEPVLAPDTAGLAEQRVTLMSDLNMLVCTGGRQRTEAEFRALLDAAGLRLASVTRVPPPTGFSVLEGVRA